MSADWAVHGSHLLAKLAQAAVHGAGASTSPVMPALTFLGSLVMHPDPEEPALASDVTTDGIRLI